jgi:hypothetical protein
VKSAKYSFRIIIESVKEADFEGELTPDQAAVFDKLGLDLRITMLLDATFLKELVKVFDKNQT